MGKFCLDIGGDDGELSISVDGSGGGVIESKLSRETCPSCGQPGCCDGSQGADEHNESDEDVASRHNYNAFIDAVESIALAHACVGIDVGDSRYVEGLRTALNAAANNL